MFISRVFLGKEVELEGGSLQGGAQFDARRLPLRGITYDARIVTLRDPPLLPAPHGYRS